MFVIKVGLMYRVRTMTNKVNKRKKYRIEQKVWWWWSYVYRELGWGCSEIVECDTPGEANAYIWKLKERNGWE